jgi:hypothetical protein
MSGSARAVAATRLVSFRGQALLVAMVLVAAACSGSGTSPAEAAAVEPAATEASHPAECFLGLDLWDTDPALTWIEDGRVWVRAGDRQACLAFTDASEISWSPDGRRLFLDDEIVEGSSIASLPDVPNARQVLWQQPLGNELLVVGSEGAASSYGIGSTEAEPLAAPLDTVLLASHPDGEHLATVDGAGSVSLGSIDSGDYAELLSLAPNERPVQIDFSPDGSRLWLLVDNNGSSRALYVDLLPVAEHLEIPPPSPLIIVKPEPLVPPPDLNYLAVDLTPNTLNLAVDVGAEGVDATGFVLHPSHPGWIVLTEGQCSDATSALFMDGDASVDDIPGAAVGFFRGGGSPILATTTAGNGCGVGSLWVTAGVPLLALGAPVLISDRVSSADIRDEAPDPWNPDTAPPFA